MFTYSFLIMCPYLLLCIEEFKIYLLKGTDNIAGISCKRNSLKIDLTLLKTFQNWVGYFCFVSLAKLDFHVLSDVVSEASHVFCFFLLKHKC